MTLSFNQDHFMYDGISDLPLCSFLNVRFQSKIFFGAHAGKHHHIPCGLHCHCTAWKTEA